MNKEEIKHFKAILRQGVLRHSNVLLDYKFQEELLKIIKDYEKLQQENKQLKDNWNKLKEYINRMHEYYLYTDVNVIYRNNSIKNEKLGYPILCTLSELHSSDKVLSSIYKKIQELEKSDKCE